MPKSGGGISISDSEYLTFSKNYFLGLKAEKGAGIFLKNMKIDVHVTNNTFTNCEAKYTGGAYHVEGHL